MENKPNIIGRLIIYLADIFDFSKRKIKVPYGSSELCYCGSEKKYKHCCKKINKKEGIVVYKIIRETSKGQKTKIKLVREANDGKDYKGLGIPMNDSSVDTIDF